MSETKTTDKRRIFISLTLVSAAIVNTSPAAASGHTYPIHCSPWRNNTYRRAGLTE
jgi:hypothetical protein